MSSKKFSNDFPADRSNPSNHPPNARDSPASPSPLDPTRESAAPPSRRTDAGPSPAATDAATDAATESDLDRGREAYRAGKLALEQGSYRQAADLLEAARDCIPTRSRLGGELQIWLTTAYQAMGRQEQALSVCRAACKHPSYNTRQQARQLLAILEAPPLASNLPKVPIPDLGNLGDDGANARAGAGASDRPVRRKRASKPKPVIQETDWSQVNAGDNYFLWVAIAAIALLLGGAAIGVL